MRLIPLLILFFSLEGFGQTFFEPAEELNKSRVLGTSIFCGLGWASSVAALQHVWYKDFEKTNFHFFNDSREWMQMDKLGHTYSAWSFSRAVGDMYHWSGLKNKKSAFIGGLVGFAYLSSFEILDAYNEAWGFSFSDLGSNFLGAGLYFGQEYFWNDQRIRMKFSYSNSGLSEYRPNVLGNSFSTRLLKDYNGQTYWLSFNPWILANKEPKIPKWINLAVGYGINNHLVGDGSTFVYNAENEQITFIPYRQYYLSLDIDFERIPTKSKALKFLFRSLNYVKFPFPTLEISKKGFAFKPLYF